MSCKTTEGTIPEVGMGATVGYGSDSYPYTIIDIKTPHRIIIQEDKAIVVKGSMSDGSAEYEYQRNPNGGLHVVTLRRDGKWKILGGTTIVHLGHRRRYYDPSF